ncbi:MAG: hypothetical protein RIT45_4008 [Pseudomonadota bacterium]
MPIPHGDGRLILAPLGGVGVIGMNNMLIGYDDDLVLLDCGVLFADHQLPGADLVLPSLSLLDRLADRLQAIVLTHGHEDHIGAVPYVASRLDLPVYGTKFTLALLEEKARHRGVGDLELHEIAPGDTIHIGKLSFTPLRVTHSLPDCVSLAIRTPVGNVLFTGDWKRDDGLPDGVRFDEAGFRAFGDEGVLAMLSDSTNAEVRGHTVSEAEVAVGLEGAIREATGRVFVGLFSSNLYRMHAVIAAARATGRKVALIGRSIFRYLDACEAWGGLEMPRDVLIDVKHVDQYEDHELVLVCTGSQGEPRAALPRIARGDHPKVKARRGDTLLMSSRKIPGNEKAIHAMLDAFAKAGVRVVHRSDKHTIHASGHAAEDELRWLLGLVRPRFFLPVHGVYTFLDRHAQLAREVGAEVPLLMTNGDVVELDASGPQKIAEVEAEPWLLDGRQVGTAASLGVHDRYEMGQSGLVAVTAVYGRGPLAVTADARGVWTKDGALLRALEDELRPWLTRMLSGGLGRESVQEELRQYVRRYFRRANDRKPVVVAQLLELGS